MKSQQLRPYAYYKGRVNNVATAQKQCGYAIVWLTILLIFTGCAASRKQSGISAVSYQNQIESSPVFQKAFTGFALFDPASGQFLYQYNADKYFTPASNTKIFTLYTSLNILADSLPALRYYQSGDSIIFTGTGDPSFLHPYLPADSSVLRFLQQASKPLYYCSGNFHENAFGPGWSWADYRYYYQPERSAFPVHGNVVSIHWPSAQDSLSISPDLFRSTIMTDLELGGETSLFKRSQLENIFSFNGKLPAPKGYHNELPFMNSDSLLVRMLSRYSGRKINLLEQCPDNKQALQTTLYSLPVDTVYRLMMQQSDNFLAEQLLLLCAGQLFDTLSSKLAIDYARQQLLSDLPDEPVWVDGSGLSRYNLFTPRSIAKLLYKLYLEVPEDRLLGIFAAGGQSGTIRSWYGGLNEPYVFAKTGTLSNKHCLSGYIKTRKGRLLIFSFMHNNFTGNSRDYKVEMEKILLNIYSSL